MSVLFILAFLTSLAPKLGTIADGGGVVMFWMYMLTLYLLTRDDGEYYRRKNLSIVGEMGFGDAKHRHERASGVMPYAHPRQSAIPAALRHHVALFAPYIHRIIYS